MFHYSEAKKVHNSFISLQNGYTYFHQILGFLNEELEPWPIKATPSTDTLSFQQTTRPYKTYTTG